MYRYTYHTNSWKRYLRRFIKENGVKLCWWCKFNVVSSLPPTFLHKDDQWCNSVLPHITNVSLIWAESVGFRVNSSWRFDAVSILGIQVAVNTNMIGIWVVHRWGISSLQRRCVWAAAPRWTVVNENHSLCVSSYPIQYNTIQYNIKLITRHM